MSAAAPKPTDYREIALLNLRGLGSTPTVEKAAAAGALAQAYATIALVDAVERLTAQVQKVTGP